MTSREDPRTWLNFRQIVSCRLGKKAAVVALTKAGTELWPVEEGATLDPDLLHRLWESPGQFYATGYIGADPHWQVTRWPRDEAAVAVEKSLGLSVYASYQRKSGPNPFPAPPLMDFG